ncbi:hypothetical protein Tco_1172460 [Tanacetum coccineum]
MNPVVTQQVAIDNALVAPEKRLKIEKYNARIEFSKPQREATYQFTLDALKLSACYPAFPITAEVPEIYMHQFWNTIKKIRDTNAYNFKLDFYSGKYEMLSAIHTDQMHQPWRTFTTIINRCIFKKTTGLDRLMEFRAQILWGVFNKNNVDYVALLWEDFMYQADNREISSASKEHMPYPRFTKVVISHFISRDNISMRNMINPHTVRDDPLLGTLKFVSKTEDYQKYEAVIPDGMINQDIKNSKAYKTYYDFATRKATPKKARKFKKIASPSRKLSPVLKAEPAKKPKKAKKPVKKSTTMPTAGVIIRDTPGVSVSKKKALAKVTKDKGIDLLSDVPNESKDKTTGTNEGTGIKPGVPDLPKYHSESDNESWGDNQDDESNDDDSDDDNDGANDDSKNDYDGDSDADDSERTNLNSDEEVNPNLNLKDNDEEEIQDDEYVRTPDYYVPTDEEFHEENRKFDEEEYDDLYKDVNITPKDTKLKNEGKGDAEMTDAGLKDVSQEKTYEQVVDDAHVTLTSTQKTDGSNQSSSVSTDFANKFLNLDNIPPTDSKVAFMMNVKAHREESSTQAPPLLTVHMTAIPKTSTVPSTIVPPTIPPFTFIPQQSTPTPTLTTEPTTSSIPALPDFSSLFGFDQRAAASLTKFELKKILLDKLQKIKSYRGAPEHKDLYEALVKSYQLDKDLFESYGLKKRKTSKDAEPPKGSKSKDSKSSSSKGTKTQPKSSGKSAQAEELMFEAADTKMPQNQGTDLDQTVDQPNVEAALKHDCPVELEYHFEECYKVVNDRLDWTNPKGQEYPFDLSKPLPLIEVQGRQVVPSDYFINNDLEYLKGGSLSRKYTTSTTKTKAAKYDNIKGIEDMVLTLWSPVKVTYDIHALWGISHWGPKLQRFYGFTYYRVSKHDVYSRKRIIAITHVTVMKWYDYGYLEKIEVRREDQTLHKFKEGDFPSLNLRDIEDMLLLLKWVEDLQLGVESYQKKLNTTRPETFRSDISNKTPYTAYNNP